MEWYVGTSGFSYPAWRGSFYPEGLPTSRMLEHYGTRLGAVEVNNTFYRLPKADVLRGWAGQVPEGFRFVVKASRRITHFARLGPEAAEPTAYLLRTVEALEDRLGAILFQLPPNLKADLGRLETFLGALPTGTPAAFEFRHPSWDDERVRALLRRHDAALVYADADDPDDGQGDPAAPGETTGPATDPDETDDPPPLVATASWGYVRLRRAGYTQEALGDWVDRLRGQGWSRAFVFFKHEDGGVGPKLAEALQGEAGR